MILFPLALDMYDSDKMAYRRFRSEPRKITASEGERAFQIPPPLTWNDMEMFSWPDSLRALTGPCLDFLRPSKNKRDDLEDPFADSGSTVKHPY